MPRNRRAERLRPTMRLLVVLLAGLFVPAMLLAQLNQLWVTRYDDGPGGDGDYADVITVDASGNIYVTGVGTGCGTGEDYRTVKYGPDGQVLWTARYDNGGTDEASDIEVDASGNVYVTGMSCRMGSEWGDFLTVKYDPNGHELWTTRDPGPGFHAYGIDMVVDAHQNVYVTGFCFWDRGTYRAAYLTDKYDANGVKVWSKYYPITAICSSSAWSIAVDGSGDVYVAGNCSAGTDPNFCVTIKYRGTDGYELWEQRLSIGQTVIHGIAVDGSNNVFVGGMGADAVGAPFDFVTVKLNGQTGQIAKEVRYDNGGEDDAMAMAVDAASNVYLTGTSMGALTGYDYATVKYDKDLNQKWLARTDFGGNDRPQGIVLDASGSVCVTGARYEANWDGDYETVKYDKSDGSLLASASYDNGGDDWAMAIAADASGGVFVTGGSWNSGTGYDYATIKYGQHVVIGATIDIDPNQLNLKSNGKWTTCYIELPKGYSVEDIDTSTVALSAIDGQPLDPLLYREGPTEIGDYDHDHISDLMVKFDRQKLIAALRGMGYGDGDRPELTVTGGLAGNTTFKGVDTIGLIDKKGGDQGSAADLPKSLSVQQSSPNPFKLTTTIRYGLPAENHVRLEVYSPAGQKVATLVDGFEGAGYYSASWDGKDDVGRKLAAGVYILKLEAGASSVTRKLVIE